MRCDSCGTADWEWDEDRFAYHAEERFCLGCYVIQMKKDTDSDSLPGTNVKLYPRGVYPPPARPPKRKAD